MFTKEYGKGGSKLTLRVHRVESSNLFKAAIETTAYALWDAPKGPLNPVLRKAIAKLEDCGYEENLDALKREMP